MREIIIRAAQRRYKLVSSLRGFLFLFGQASVGCRPLNTLAAARRSIQVIESTSPIIFRIPGYANQSVLGYANTPPG
jgi:hypothetical protein